MWGNGFGRQLPAPVQTPFSENLSGDQQEHFVWNGRVWLTLVPGEITPCYSSDNDSEMFGANHNFADDDEVQQPMADPYYILNANIRGDSSESEG